MSAESQELQEILSKIDVSDIASVEFVPADGESFRLDTDNIKKLTRYITTKREKEYFLPHELDKTYGYVIDHLYTDISEDKYAEIRKQMKVFIEQGGYIEMHIQPIGGAKQTSTQKQYSGTLRFFQVFISLFIIGFGAIWAFCGGMATFGISIFGAGRGFNPFLLPGFLAGFIFFLAWMVMLWKTERIPLIWYRIRLYSFTIAIGTIIFGIIFDWFI